MAYYSNQISTNRAYAGSMMSSYQERRYSLGQWDIRQQNVSRVYQGAVATNDFILVGRVGCSETSTTLQNSTHRLTTRQEDVGGRVLLIDRRQPHNRVMYDL